uniref:Putative secreted protein n=1 Tax=Anopheles marajoara TaxID=58244 RepID=A0A2M4C9T6_9DIPT
MCSLLSSPPTATSFVSVLMLTLLDSYEIGNVDTFRLSCSTVKSFTQPTTIVLPSFRMSSPRGWQASFMSTPVYRFPSTLICLIESSIPAV